MEKEKVIITTTQDGHTKTVEQKGNVTTITTTTKEGKTISFEAMIVGQGNANIVNKLIKEVIVSDFENEEKNSKTGLRGTITEDVTKSISILPSGKAKKHKHKPKTFYNNDENEY